jgi:hypothetical protein
MSHKNHQQNPPSGVANQPPSLMEMIGAMNALQHQNASSAAPVDNSGNTFAKTAGGVIVALVLALMVWVGSTLSGLTTSMATLTANVSSVQKSIADLQTSQGSAAQQLADGKANDAKQDARLDAHEADTNRIKERIRMLEGQEPLTSGSRSDR